MQNKYRQICNFQVLVVFAYFFYICKGADSVPRYCDVLFPLVSPVCWLNPTFRIFSRIPFYSLIQYSLFLSGIFRISMVKKFSNLVLWFRCLFNTNKQINKQIFTLYTGSCNSVLGSINVKTIRFRNLVKSISSVLSILHLRKLFSHILSVPK